jgi:hypothetical protein
VICHKELGRYSVSVHVWHTETSGALNVHSSIWIKKDGVEVERDSVPLNILLKFDRFADECVADYVDHLEE